MIEGFKKFIARGNMIDMAVGVVMGGAVTTVVNSIVNNVINPFIAMIFGKPNMDGLLAITFNNATVSFGAVLGAILNFLIIAAAVYFCILVPINKFRDVTEALLAKTKLAEERSKAEEEAAKEPEISTEEQTILLLQQNPRRTCQNGMHRMRRTVPNDSRHCCRCSRSAVVIASDRNNQ